MSWETHGMYFSLITLTAEGDTQKYAWLASPDQPDFCPKVWVGGSVSIKTEK